MYFNFKFPSYIVGARLLLQPATMVVREMFWCHLLVAPELVHFCFHRLNYTL